MPDPRPAPRSGRVRPNGLGAERGARPRWGPGCALSRLGPGKAGGRFRAVAVRGEAEPRLVGDAGRGRRCRVPVAGRTVLQRRRPRA